MVRWTKDVAPYRGLKVMSYHNQFIYFLTRFGLLQIRHPRGSRRHSSHADTPVPAVRAHAGRGGHARPRRAVGRPEAGRSRGPGVGGSVIPMAAGVGAVKGANTYIIEVIDYNVRILTRPGGKEATPRRPLAQSRRRHLAICLLDERCHHRPVGTPVDPHADPAPLPDIGRPEESHGIQEDHRLLLAERRGQPDREMVGAVMVIVELGEELAFHAPRGLAPRDLLRRLGERQANRPQPLDGRARGPRAPRRGAL